MSKLVSTKHSREIIRDSTDDLAIKKVADGEKDRELDLAFLMGAARGRRWLHELIFTKCHVGLISHVPRDTHSTAFNEGARSVGEALLEEIRSKHHALYLKMLEENDVREP